MSHLILSYYIQKKVFVSVELRCFCRIPLAAVPALALPEQVCRVCQCGCDCEAPGSRRSTEDKPELTARRNDLGEFCGSLLVRTHVLCIRDTCSALLVFFLLLQTRLSLLELADEEQASDNMPGISQAHQTELSPSSPRKTNVHCTSVPQPSTKESFIKYKSRATLFATTTQRWSTSTLLITIKLLRQCGVEAEEEEKPASSIL